MADDINGLGLIQAGAFAPGNIPDELLIYDQDKTGLVLYIEQGTSKMMHMINTEFGKRNVTSFTPKWFDVNQLDHAFTVKADQVQATWNQITLSNQHAVQLQSGDMLVVDGLFLEDGANGGTAGTYSTTFSNTARMEEVLLVTQEPIPDSAGSGLAFVNVRRGYSNGFTTKRIMSEPAFSATGLIKTDARLLKMGNTHWTGSDAPHGIFKALEIDSNPLQIMRFAFEQQVEASYERNLDPEDPMVRSEKLILKRMAYEMEFRALFGRANIEQQNGSWRYSTGGLFEYVTNIIDYSNNGNVVTMDWQKFQSNVMAPLFELGGSERKVGFTSITTFSNFATMLWNKVTIQVDESWSERFSFDIYKIAGGGGELSIVPSWVYGRNRTRANQMLVLDFGGPYFKIDVMEDIHKNMGPGGNGLQLPGQRIKKYEYIGINGLQRRGAPYHAVVTGFPAVI